MQQSLQENINLGHFNTFGIDVEARWFYALHHPDAFADALSSPQVRNLPKLVLGGGSNILFTESYNGLVIKNEVTGLEVCKEDAAHVWLKVGGGVNWHKLVTYTLANKWQGLENLSLIPGTVGAAPVQNIGAYGVELKDCFHQLEAIDISDGSQHLFSLADCSFGYRNSIFKNAYKGRFIITTVTFKLNKKPEFVLTYAALRDYLAEHHKKEPFTADAISQAVIAIRQSKLPDPSVIGNCGSFFKNPEITEALFQELQRSFPNIVGYPLANGTVKLAAGWLIEKAGLKGFSRGRVGTYPKQALVMVNLGGASGTEARDFAQFIQQKVKETFGVALVPEVNIH